MIKTLNGYLLTKKIKQKHLVQLCPYLEAKTSSMMEHVKLPIREINPDHIVLHAGTNELRTENTVSQIKKATTDQAKFLKYN